MNTKNYKKVENLFEGVSKNVKASRSLIEKPYVIEDFGDNIYIREQVMMTLDDGIEVERCCWSEADLKAVMRISRNTLKERAFSLKMLKTIRV